MAPGYEVSPTHSDQEYTTKFRISSDIKKKKNQWQSLQHFFR